MIPNATASAPERAPPHDGKKPYGMYTLLSPNATAALWWKMLGLAKEVRKKAELLEKQEE